MSKEIKAQIIRHGELILKPINKIPNGAELKEITHKKIVAWSETHHHHILEVKDKVDLSKLKVYTWNGETYLEVPQISELWHQKTGKDTHKKHTIQPSFYKVIIKKQFDYFTKSLQRVRD